MTFEIWERPPLFMALKNRPAYEDFLRRVDAWEKENAELAKAWDEAFSEDHKRNEERERLEAERKHQARIWSRLQEIGVPTRSVDALRGSAVETAATNAVKAHQEGSRAFLLLFGAPGTGKTVAAVQGLYGAFLATSPYFLRDTAAFVRAIEAARLSQFDGADQERFRKMKQAKLLVLDDLGAEMLHDGWRPMLDELIDYRYGERLKTIVTSNLDAKAFKERYGDRIVDRIRHDGAVCQCGEQSMRRPEIGK